MVKNTQQEKLHGHVYGRANCILSALQPASSGALAFLIDSGQRVILDPSDFSYGPMSPRQLTATAQHIMCCMKVLPVSACLSCLSCLS
jgi:hypothetical protein